MYNKSVRNEPYLSSSELMMSKKNMSRAEQILSLREQGMSYKAIAARTDVSKNTVYQVLARAGKTSSRGAQKRLSDEEKKRIVELRQSGATYIAISMELGRSCPVVNRVLREAGLVGRK